MADKKQLIELCENISIDLSCCNLKALGFVVGIDRKEGETDDEFRDRIKLRYGVEHGRGKE